MGRNVLKASIELRSLVCYRQTDKFFKSPRFLAKPLVAHLHK
jgi:hypothetical protein